MLKAMEQASNDWGYPFDIPSRLLGLPQTLDWPLPHPVEHAFRRGSMLRMTSRKKVTLWRYGDSRRAAQGAQPLERSK